MLSRRAGVLTALGIGLGVWVHLGYTLLGVGVLMRQSAWLFGAAKLAGAAYLIYLGWKMLRSPPGDLAATAARPVSGLGALRTGFLTNALNRKTTVFFVSLFMQVVDPQTPLGVQLAYGAFISLAHGLVQPGGGGAVGTGGAPAPAGLAADHRPRLWRRADGAGCVAGDGAGRYLTLETRTTEREGRKEFAKDAKE